MRRPDLGPGPARALLAGAVVASLVVAVVAALLGGGGDGVMSPEQAVTFTERALEEAGVTAVVGVPIMGTFEAGGEEEPVWVVPAIVGVRQIALSVDADGDKALNLADGLGDGSNVLSEEEFVALARFRYDPLEEDTTLASALALLGALAVALALGAVVRTRRVALPLL